MTARGSDAIAYGASWDPGCIPRNGDAGRYGGKCERPEKWAEYFIIKKRADRVQLANERLAVRRRLRVVRELNDPFVIRWRGRLTMDELPKMNDGA